MAKIIVTAGEKYNDIDALACSIAYQKLLELRGMSSEVVLTGPLNESVSASVKSLNFSFYTSFDGNLDDYPS